MLRTRPARKYRGTSVMELLLTVTAILVIGRFAVMQVTGVKESSEAVRMRATAAMLNAAVATYLENGGRIPRGSSAEDVLAKLKTRILDYGEDYHPGLKGPFIDVRLTGLPAALDSRTPRVAWDGDRGKFLVALEGSGWSEVNYDDREAVADHGTEERYALASFARESRWVWDYSEAGFARQRMSQIPVTSPALPQILLPDEPPALRPPVIFPGTGIFDHRSFPLTLTITDQNPPGEADILYQLNGGEWQVWQGGQSPLSKSLSSSVKAFARAREGSLAIDSEIVQEDYTTYFLRGEGSGRFTNSVGESLAVIQTGGAGGSVRWGKAESAGQSMSELSLQSGDPFEAGPGESFALGTLTFRNGVTRAGTNLQSTTLLVDLAFSVPDSGSLTIQIPVRILNSIHYPWVPPEERQDHVWVPREVYLSPPLEVLDRHFVIRLNLSAPGAEDDGSELKVAVSENTSAELAMTASIEQLD